MKTFENVASLKLARLNANQFVETGGFTVKGGTGAKRYFTKTTAQAAADGDVVDDVHTNFVLANGIVAIDTSKPVIEHYTLAETKALTGAVVGQIIQITDRGNGQFEAVSSITNPPDELGVIQGQGAIAWKVLVHAFIDVTWFGAVGDGASFDTDSVQAACDWPIAEGKKVVLFPNGAFRLGRVVINDNNTWLRGDSARLILAPETNDSMFYMPDKRINIQFEGFEFDGNQVNQSAGNCYLIDSYRSEQLKIFNNVFKHWKTSAIYCRGSGTFHQRGLEIYNNFFDGFDLPGCRGIYLDYNIYRGTITENTMTNCEDAIYCETSINACTFTSNNFYDNENCISIVTFDSASNTIVGNNFNNNRNFDINGVGFSSLIAGNTFYENEVVSVYIYGAYDHNCLVEGNLFRSCPRCVVVEENARRTSIKDNHIDNGSALLTGSSANPIVLSANTSMCDVSGNKINFVGGDGIEVKGSYHNIQNNHITNVGLDDSNVRYGIDVAGSNCRVTGNLIDDDQGTPTSGGIRLSSSSSDNKVKDNIIERFNGTPGDYVDLGANNLRLSQSTNQRWLRGENPSYRAIDNSTGNEVGLHADFGSGGSAQLRSESRALIIATGSSNNVIIQSDGSNVARATTEQSFGLYGRGSDPSSPSEGDIYFNSTTKKLRCFDGAIWNDLF